jgi:hypothetical protein
VAQLSPWLLWPPDGLNLKQGTCGELFGYGYLPLPLTQTKRTTAGVEVPTGNQSWTLFLNTGNFKGPVAFFTPYFFSRPSVDRPELGGLFLDSRPSNPNRALQMETQYVPAVLAEDEDGDVYARVAPAAFPRGQSGAAALVHRVTSYTKKALWDDVLEWFEDGRPATGEIDSDESFLSVFKGEGYATWKIFTPSSPKEDRLPLDWSSFATPVTLDSHTYGFQWNKKLVRNETARNSRLVMLPEYFRLDKSDEKWKAMRDEGVPLETGLRAVPFRRPVTEPLPPYVTPDDPESCWKTPGPVAGPFQARLGDGSVVTYFWYRFADQPALLNADLTPEEREELQRRVEMLHRSWNRHRAYLPPPSTGELADLDPALIVDPPGDLDVGYVPIVTRQEAVPHGRVNQRRDEKSNDTVPGRTRESPETTRE